MLHRRTTIELHSSYRCVTYGLHMGHPRVISESDIGHRWVTLLSTIFIVSSGYLTICDRVTIEPHFAYEKWIKFCTNQKRITRCVPCYSFVATRSRFNAHRVFKWAVVLSWSQQRWEIILEWLCALGSRGPVDAIQFDWPPLPTTFIHITTSQPSLRKNSAPSRFHFGWRAEIQKIFQIFHKINSNVNLGNPNRQNLIIKTQNGRKEERPKITETHFRF